MRMLRLDAGDLMFDTKLLKHPIMSHLFEHKCSLCRHVFYEVDTQVPRACPGCGERNPLTEGFGPKSVL
jgi:hypothetical protein